MSRRPDLSGLVVTRLARMKTTMGSTRRALAGWRVLLFALALSWVPALATQDAPVQWIPMTRGADSLARPADSLAGASPFRTTGRALPGANALSQLPDSLAADSTATPTWWQLLWAKGSTWPQILRHLSPQNRPLPTLSESSDRPAEDLADQLLPLVPGPFFDQGQVGHRQLLALDGLRPGASTLVLDGIDLSSRISGLADVNLVAPGLCLPAGADVWNRLGERPGGLLSFRSRRATNDSVLTRVAWADGFMGFISVDGDFQRPLLGGRFQAASRQIYTHERVPGAEFRGNVFQWNWDRPVAGDWLLRLDQRLLHDRGDVLDADGQRRSLDQSLLRARLGRTLGTSRSMELDAWQREDRLAFDRVLKQRDAETLRALSLSLDEVWAGGGWRVQATGEHQQLSSDDWKSTRLEERVEATAAWTLLGLGRRWVVEPAATLRHTGDDQLWGGSAGLRLGASGLKSWADLLLHGGRLAPTAEQLHLTRKPLLSDAVISPWRRDANLNLVGDSTLGASSWQRQELRLGTRALAGRLSLAMRAWRVELRDDPLETPDSLTWTWKGWNHVQAGAQAFLGWQLSSRWRVDAAQAWFHDNRELISREFPQWMSDAVLTHERLLFRRELNLRVTMGLHHEYGGVDSRGNALWAAPEVWVKGEATRGAFSLMWALRNPFGLADNARVEDRPLHGHEEWLGVRWVLKN